jgi:hypothetical protein
VHNSEIILTATAFLWLLFSAATAEESQWYLWAVGTMWNKPVNCDIYHATPEQAIEAMNNYSERQRRNLSPSSPTQGFIVSYQLVDKGDAGLVTETVPPGVPKWCDAALFPSQGRLP